LEISFNQNVKCDNKNVVNEKNVVLCLLEIARIGAKLGMLAPTIVQMEEEITAFYPIIPTVVVREQNFAHYLHVYITEPLYQEHRKNYLPLFHDDSWDYWIKCSRILCEE
jgi:hypothetical protein